MQMKFFGRASLLALVVALAAQLAEAQDGSVSTSKEPERLYGLNVGLGDPFPGLFGFNVGYNLNKDVRLTAGYAEVEVTTSLSFDENGFSSQSVKATTYAVGGQYLFTDWGFRPTVGLHAGYFGVSGSGDISVNGFNKSGAYGYSNLGFDWIAQSGFHFATGMNVAFLNGTGSGFYANMGYFY